MLIDFRQLDSGATLDAELCIIGAGAAGIAIAREFAGSGVRVLLVESGGLEFEKKTQDLYNGPSTGFKTKPMDESRLRYFGGTTNHWTGRCGVLDEMDFETRAWLPLSGWPIRKADLVPFYRRAAKVCELDEYGFDETTWQRFEKTTPDFERTKIRPFFWQYSPPTLFGGVYRAQLVGAKNLRILLHANVTEIVSNEDGSAVTHLELRTMDGKRGRATAKQFVLACGGIENPRLLLASDRFQRGGLGNRHDLVGRFLSDHPAALSGLLVSKTPPLVATNPVRNGVTYLPGYRLGDETQKRKEVLSACAYFTDDAGYSDLFLKRDWPGKLPDHAIRSFIVCFVEQPLDRASRVFLSGKRDAIGQRRAGLDWKNGEREKRAIKTLMLLLGAEFARLGIGRVKLAKWLIWDESYWGMEGGDHFMCTTRMSDDPKTGVVDKHCRLFGVSNLHVAGSSVFSATGYINPTLTIVALALRLADRLKSKFG